MPRPAAAPPTLWSPWAPGCPLPWTAAQKRKLCPRRGSAPPVEAWDRMRRHFLWAQLGCKVFRCTAEEGSRRGLTRYAGLQLPTGTLLGLESRSWKRGERGEPQDGPVSYWTDRPAAGPRRPVSVEFEPGITNGMPSNIPSRRSRSWLLSRPRTASLRT